MSVPRVFVSGCGGYIGSVLVGYLLRAKCKVVGVDNLSYRNSPALLPHLGDPNFEFHYKDVFYHELAVQDLAAKCDVVIPLAAIVGAPACDKEPGLAKAVNYLAVRNLVKSLSGDQRVIFTNTNSGYGQTDGESFVTEEDPLNPVSVYGVTKCQGEQAVLEHPDSVSLRLATVFGASPRMRFDLMVNDFTHKLWRDRRLEVFDPDYKRNFVHVRDVCRAILHFILNPNYTGVFNVGLPEANLTKIELARFVAARLEVPQGYVTVGQGKDPDNRNYLVSNDKLLSTGFRFEYGLAQGISEVAKICETHYEYQIRTMRNV